MTDPTDPNECGSETDDQADDTPENSEEGTFLVTHAEAESAVLRDVDDGRVHTLSSNPGVETEDVLEAAIAPEPPLEVTHRVIEVESRRRIPIEESPEPPTEQERDLAADQAVGEVTREPRAGVGELHVITVPEETTSDAVGDVLDDRETTIARAARLGVNRVEIRSEPGIVSVRYLP
jgi:hypothetical protein